MSKSAKPVLVFDGDCGFCRRWVEDWKRRVGDQVSFVPSQQYSPAHPEIPAAEFAGSVQLFEDGRRFSGAEAVFRTLARAPGGGVWLSIYRRVPPFAWAGEFFYAQVARHRVFFSRLTRLMWGDSLEPGTHRLTRSIFLKLVALSYFAAFASFWGQARGLIGHDGILPFNELLAAVRARFPAEHLRLLPTLFWLSPTDAALSWACGAGTMLSALFFLDFAPAPILAVLWVLWLSIVEVGGDFMSFQWDMLLLETGFLALLLAPWRLRRGSDDPEPPAIALWLPRVLLFRLMFESGCVKLLSGDAAWRDLTALYYHYETQPLPTRLGWWAHQLPHLFQRASASAMFAVELAAPWLIFFPRRPRMAAGLAIAGLMLLIAATGNYCFFNLLALALCATLFDDRFWERVLRRSRPKAEPRPASTLRRRASWLAAAPLLGAGALQVLGLFFGGLSVPSWFAAGFNALQATRLVNSYGLFAVMTRPRFEIAIEGSDDGSEWIEYPFRWKPGPLDRAPGFIEPFQPRLDWQMWFAALGTYQENRWFMNLLGRLLQGQPEVLALLDHDPFPQGPPKFIRGQLYEYRFTSWSERRETGHWWKRELRRPYSPVFGKKS